MKSATTTTAQSQMYVLASTRRMHLRASEQRRSSHRNRQCYRHHMKESCALCVLRSERAPVPRCAYSRRHAALARGRSQFARVHSSSPLSGDTYRHRHYTSVWPALCMKQRRLAKPKPFHSIIHHMRACFARLPGSSTCVVLSHEIGSVRAHSSSRAVVIDQVAT